MKVYKSLGYVRDKYIEDRIDWMKLYIQSDGKGILHRENIQGWEEYSKEFTHEDLKERAFKICLENKLTDGEVNIIIKSLDHNEHIDIIRKIVNINPEFYR